MPKREGGPKLPLTIRVEPTSRAGLDELARSTNRTMSSLIDQAVQEFLVRQSIEGHLSPDDMNTGLCLDTMDIERMHAVMQAIGVPIPLKIFLEIIETQRAANPKT